LSSSANLAYSQVLAGDWDAVLDVTEPLLAEEIPNRDRLIMLNNYGIVRANRGEPIDDILDQMRDLTAGMKGKSGVFLTDPIGNYALARGDLQGAAAAWLELADEEPSNMTEFGYRAARPMLWDRRDPSEIRGLYDRIAELGAFSPAAEARLATLEGGIAALEGRPADALVSYREALGIWRAIHARWDEALTGMDMAELLDPSDPEVAEVIKSTRAILEGLRAQPYLERLERAASREVGEPSHAKKLSRKTQVAVGE
jgi:hypothetical protein